MLFYIKEEKTVSSASFYIVSIAVNIEALLRVMFALFSFFFIQVES
jgi:hypothetical protein